MSWLTDISSYTKHVGGVFFDQSSEFFDVKLLLTILDERGKPWISKLFSDSSLFFDRILQTYFYVLSMDGVFFLLVKCSLFLLILYNCGKC